MISVTDLCAYAYCPRQLYQQKVLGRPARLSREMILGSIRHKMHDAFNKAEAEIVARLGFENSEADFTKAYCSEYTLILQKILKGHENALIYTAVSPETAMQKFTETAMQEAMERSINVLRFAAEKKLAGSELWDALTPKIMTEVRIKSNKLRLKGTIDRIELHRHQVIPIELKTGKAPASGCWPVHRIQAAAYMMLLSEKYGSVTEAVLRYMGQKDVAIKMNPYMELEVAELTEKTIRLLEGSIPSPCGRDECQCKR